MVTVSAKHSGPLMTWGALWDLWHPHGIHGVGGYCRDPDGSGKEHEWVWRTLRSPLTGLHALDQDSLSYSPWEGGANSLERRHWVQVRGQRSGVRGRGEMGHRWGNSYMETCSDTQTNICSLTSVH